MSMVLGMDPRALHMLSGHATTEPHPRSSFLTSLFRGRDVSLCKIQ